MDTDSDQEKKSSDFVKKLYQKANECNALQEMYISENGIRISHGQMIIIANIDQQSFYYLYPTQKKGNGISFDEANNISKSNTFGQSLFDSMMRGAEQIQISPTDEIKEISGYNCKKYIMKGDGIEGEYWVSKEFKSYDKLKHMENKIEKALIGLSMIEDLNIMSPEMDGLMIKSIVKITGITTVKTIVNLEEKTLDKSIFMVPDDYQFKQIGRKAVKDNQTSLQQTPTISKTAKTNQSNITAQVMERKIFIQSGHSDIINHVVFSPDGKFILSASHDRTVKLWDTSTGDQIRTFKGHSGAINTVEISSDGQYVLSGGSDKILKLWDISSGKEIQSFSGHTKEIKAAKFTPDGNAVLSCSSDNLRLWDISSGKQIRTFESKPSNYFSLEFVEEGKYVLSISGPMNSSVKLWDMSTGQEIRSLSIDEQIYAADISQDGNFILLGTATELIQYDIMEGKDIERFKITNQSNGRQIVSVAFSPDQQFALAGIKNDGISLWDIASGQNICRYSGFYFNSLKSVISPDGKYALTGDCFGKLSLYNMFSEKEAIRHFLGQTTVINSVDISSDGRFILSGSGRFSRDPKNNTMRLWDLLKGKQLHSFNGDKSGVISVAFSTDGKSVFMGNQDNIKQFNIETGEEINSFETGRDASFALAFSPDRRFALSGKKDGKLSLFDLSEKKSEYALKGHHSPIISAAFSSSGKFALSGSWDGRFKLWDIQTKKEIMNCFAGVSVFSPDEKFILSADKGGDLAIWNIDAKEIVLSLKGHSDKVTALAFNHNGQRALSGSAKETIILWNIKSGQEIRSFYGHLSQVKSLVFSPDEQLAISGSADGSLRIWEIETGKEVYGFFGFDNGEWAVLTPDGYYNSSPDGEKYIYARVEPLKVVPIKQLSADFFRADIVMNRLHKHR